MLNKKNTFYLFLKVDNYCIVHKIVMKGTKNNKNGLVWDHSRLHAHCSILSGLRPPQKASYLHLQLLCVKLIQTLTVFTEL